MLQTKLNALKSYSSFVITYNFSLNDEGVINESKNGLIRTEI